VSGIYPFGGGGLGSGSERPQTYEEVDIGETRYAGLSFYFHQRRIEEGLKNAREALGGLGGLGAKPACRDFLDQLAGAEQAERLTGAVLAAARAAFDQGLLYDGPTSMELLDEERFGDSNIHGLRTVAEWFQFDNRRQALSQQNGNAIWIRAEDWTGIFSSFRDGDRPSAYALGTLVHEFLHKQHVGSYGHTQMLNALERAGYSHFTYGRNQISDAIGRMCF
jgi:hypothetical protein